uniref:Uncharacterized protein n=1 Tax=Oryza meridionalis TaxID=40149 RepID=A0A0E0E1V7_9ORYZ
MERQGGEEKKDGFDRTAEGEAATGGAMRLQASEAAGSGQTGQWAVSTAVAMDTSAARPYRSCDCCPVPTARG